MVPIGLVYGDTEEATRTWRDREKLTENRRLGRIKRT
jgi:hypothetical protein